MHCCIILLALFFGGTCWQAPACPCAPAAQIKSEIEKAAGKDSSGPFAITTVLPALAALREKYAGDLFVNEAYQDAVRKHGIEGYLQGMTDEYQGLDSRHPGELIYHYLFLRSLIGRNTPAAIQGLTQILAENPNFAPASRALTQIYALDAFRDAEKEKRELERLHSLCPGWDPGPHLDTLPARSTLLDQAERAVAESGDPDKIISMTQESLSQDEWRLQRIRPFDWYSVDYKRQAYREIRQQYWKAWTLQVRCYRKAGRTEDAAGILDQMERGALSMRKESPLLYWDSLGTLARLYIEGKQIDKAKEKIDLMQHLLVEHPDPERSAALERLRQMAGT